MDLCRLYLPELRIQALIGCVRSFSRDGEYKPAHQFLRLLGLMAATLQSMEYAHLHLQPIQWYLKCLWTAATYGLHHPVFVNRKFVHTLSWWLHTQHLSQGMPFITPNATFTITTDSSMVVWGGHCLVPGSGMVLYSGLWTWKERQLYIILRREWCSSSFSCGAPVRSSCS